MRPTSGKHAAAAEEHQQQRHISYSPRKSKKIEIRTTLQSLKAHISSHRWVWLSATISLQLLLVLLLIRASPPPPPPPPILPSTQHRQIETTSQTGPDGVCQFGRVYIYDLPPMLNEELLQNCHEIDPWSSRCNAVSNDGFGPPAVGLNDVVPRNLTSAWYWTDMYSAEVIYHERMKNHICRTMNQDEATAFYIPFYAGLAVGRYLWFNYTSKDRDFHSVTMLNWVKNQTPWMKSNGSDHFIVLGRLTWDFRRLTDNDNEWGTRFIYMPLMKNVLKLSVERSPWDLLEISIPYPTAFHPRSESDIRIWQDFIRSRKRSSLLTFVGATRKKIKNDFRTVLMSYCKNESSWCQVVDCAVTRCYDGAPAILEGFLDSDFCMQPKGDGSTRRSAFDCMLAGTIPVYFWRGSFENQFEWHLPAAYDKYSVFIDNNDVRNDSSIIKKILQKYSIEEVKKMRERIIDFVPKFLYSRSNVNLGKYVDAFDIAMDEVLIRFSRQKMFSNHDQ
ncbi:xyloglucan galactosyltransferase XLT2-like [Primulina huaijiensis]|uniref:xyloglucan galactosyltransferase XLT2-like n=1 Tax=Primulina huaijiensis TaxID=1492673 RepID=UPI003CC794CF